MCNYTSYELKTVRVYNSVMDDFLCLGESLFKMKHLVGVIEYRNSNFIVHCFLL